jgi:hypothetical protein
MNRRAEPTVKWETVTPERAQQILDTSAGNRNINRNQVERFSDIMEGGTWVLNGDTVVFDENGHLLDGHHRMHGVVMSGTTVRMLIVRGVRRRDALHTIDIGLARSLRHFFQLSKVPHAQPAAAITSIVWSFRHPQLSMNCRTKEVGFDALLALHDETPAIARFASSYASAEATAFRGMTFQTMRTFGAFAHIDSVAGDTTEFWRAVVLGVGFNGTTDPRAALHRRLIELKQILPHSSKSYQRSRRYHLALVVNAWNAWVKGRQLKVLIGVKDGSPFPTVRVAP